MFETLVTEKNAGVARLWLNRPDARNAFNPLMIDELITALTEIAADSSIQLLILRGKNNQFCSGADIKWMQASGRLSPEENEQESRRIADLLEVLYALPVPTLAVAEGSVFGGAMGLLAACDWIYAADNCRFGFPEVHLGIIPAIIWPYILLRSHPVSALQKALTGKPFSADEAIRLNLADPMPEADLEASIERLIQELTQGPAPDAQREMKRLNRQLQQKPDERVIMRTIEILSTLKRSPNGQEGLTAFIEKRRPEWK